MTDKIIALTTCGSHEEAERIARALVNARLAACVNIVPGVRSIYLWRGQVEDAPELLLVMKTRRALLAELEKVVRAVHSYETPELIALAIVDGLGEYLSWIDVETNAPPEDV